MSTIYIKTRDISPGLDVSFICEHSGRPLTRTTQHGMFCDAAECECEQKSREAESSSEFVQLEKLVDLFSRWQEER